jgi:glyoxylase-like metal-dependent hydrolase (beta-lactamase superfamily II)/catechol 2,3-dioxygenase-like lactoylglutathione lyase family enzyme
VAVCLGILALVALGPRSARAQLAPFNGAGVTFGHVHLFVSDIEVHKKFWIEVMGGTWVDGGPLQMVRFPGAYIVLTKQESSGPPEGSVLNHFGFVYKDLPATLARWKAMGADARQGGNPNQGYVWGPDGINVEYYGDPAIPVPVKMDHTHSFVPDIKACKEWYRKAFGGVPGQRPRVSQPGWNEVVHFPGMTVTFAGGPGGAAQAPTRGRSLDHVGFEVANLDEYARKLAGLGIVLDTAPRRMPNSRIKVAYLTDPWGTRIELTENLDSAARLGAPTASTSATRAEMPAYPQQEDTGRAGGRGRGAAGRGAGRGGEQLPQTALISERGLTAADFPTLRSTTGGVYVWQDVHALGFLTNNLVVVTPEGVLIADGQGSPEAVRKLVEAVRLLTPKPIKYVVACSEHGDHTGGNEAFPATASLINSARTLKMGGTEIQILNTGRSHTGKDLQVYLPQEKVLFTSESFSNHIFPSMASGYPSEWLETVKKLRQLDATFVVPGHGFLDPAPVMKTAIGEFEQALEYAIGEVRRIHRSGVGVEDGLMQVNWGPYQKWSMSERNGPPAFRRIYDELNGKIAGR